MSNLSARPAPISRAYDLLQKIAAYKELNDDDDNNTEECQTASRSSSQPLPPANTDEYNAAAAPTTNSNGRRTPLLEIVPDHTAVDSPAMLSTGVQTTTPLETTTQKTFKATSPVHIEPPPGETQPPQPDEVDPPPSLNQSSVIGASTANNETINASNDDPRRVVIHSLTPPRVTTVIRHGTPRGFFSSGIAPLDDSMIGQGADHWDTQHADVQGDAGHDARAIEARYAKALHSFSQRFARDAEAPSTQTHEYSGLTASERLSRRAASEVIHFRNDASMVRQWERDAPNSVDFEQSAGGLELSNLDADWLMRSRLEKRRSSQRQESSNHHARRHTTTTADVPVASVSLVPPEPSRNPPTPTPRHSTRGQTTPVPVTRRPAKATTPVRRDQRSGGLSPRALQDTFSSATRRRAREGALTPQRAPLVSLTTTPHTVGSLDRRSPTSTRGRPASHPNPQPIVQSTSTRIGASTPTQRVSEYTKKMLKEHQDRIASQRSKLSKNHLTADVSHFSSRSDRTAVTAKEAQPPPRQTAHNSSTSRSNGHADASRSSWEPMPNRHAIGGNSSSAHLTPTTRSRNDAAHASLSRGGEFLATQAADDDAAGYEPQGPMPDERCESSAIVRPPLMEYLRSMASGPASFVCSELAGMNVAALDNGRTVTAEMCTHWVTLTVLANQPVCLEEIVVPLLVAELTNRIDEAGALGGRSTNHHRDPSADITHLLCALCGIGHSARAALGVLFDMLENGVGDSNLVGLTIRACGGDAAIKKLCTIASDPQGEFGPQSQLTAVSALGLLPEPYPGHTSILCLGLAQLQGKKMFYQPRTTPHPGGPSQSDEKDPLLARPCVTPHQAGFRSTFVFLDAEMVRRYLAQLTSTALYHKRHRELSGTASTACILRDFFAAAPFVCSRLQCDPTVHEHLAIIEADARPWLPDSDDEGGPSLANHLAYLWQHEPLLGRHITMTLVRLLHNRDTLPSVVERALRTISVLPPLASEVLAEPLVDFTTALVDQAARDTPTRPSQELVKEAVLATSRVVNPEVHPQRLVDSATAIAVHLLRSDDVPLSRAGCIALGTMGPISSNPQAVIKLIVEALMDARLPPSTCCWALARSGRHGAACLVDIASQIHLGPSQRVEAAKALGFLTITSGPHGEGSELVAGAVRGLMRLVLDHMAKAHGEALAVAALHSLVELHQRAHKRGEQRMQHATTATLCNMLQEILSHGTIASAKPALLRELYLSLCRLGGARGLLMTSEALTGVSPLHATVAAVYGLRGAGAACAPALAEALAHNEPDVRLEAAESLLAIWPASGKAMMRSTVGVESTRVHLNSALHLHGPGKAASLMEQWLAGLDSRGSGGSPLTMEGAF